MSTQKKTGSCLCGSVQITANAVSNHVGSCHCSMCRKWGGGPFLAVDCGTDVVFSGESNIGAFPSSQWADRGFCKKCGTHLFYRLTENQQYMMPASLFEQAENFELKQEIFIDEKPDWYSFQNDTNKMTGAEVFAQFTQQQDN